MFLGISQELRNTNTTLRKSEKMYDFTKISFNNYLEKWNKRIERRIEERILDKKTIIILEL